MNVLIEYPVFIVAPEGFLEKDNLFVELSESDAGKRKEEEEEMTGIPYTIRQGSVSLPVTFIHGRPYFNNPNKANLPVQEEEKKIKRNAMFARIEENEVRPLNPVKKKVLA
jgi:hypothetical protein